MHLGNGRKRILVVGNGAIGLAKAGERFINDHTGQLLLELGERGFVPTYIAPGTTYDTNSNLLNFELVRHGIDSIALDIGSKTAAFRSLPVMLLAVIRAAHVYIFFPGTLGALVTLFCRLMRKPYGLYVRGSKYGHGHFGRSALKSASFILTVSPSITEEQRAYCPNVATIRPMLAIDLSDKMVRQKMRSLPDRWKLLFVGNLSVDKGIRELMVAARTLHDKGFPFHLKLVGGGVLYDELSSDLEADILASHVEFTGLVSDREFLMREYEQADIFVLPTYHEGFPRVLYEAMIKGLTIVTTMVGGIPGRMVHRHNCVAIPVKDAAAIVEAIELIASDPALLFDVGRRGQETVLDVLENNRSHCELIVEHLENHAR